MLLHATFTRISHLIDITKAKHYEKDISITKCFNMFFLLQ